jgi:hypothetical protein
MGDATRVAQKVKCLTCGAIIQSQHRHDFVMCNCGRGSNTFIYVDGGTDYLRLGACENARYEMINDEAQRE